MNYFKKALSYIQIFLEKPVEKELIKNLPLRIYHFHIRKTGGTTINFAFYYNSGYKDLELFYKTIIKSYNHRSFGDGLIYIAWNRTLINSGRYFYAHSHLPMHKLSIPDYVFTITCLRDPVKRVISHYKMLRYYQKTGINKDILKQERKWLSDNILDFVKKLPKYHLKNQLYFFSKNFDLSEAIENIAKVDFLMFTETLDNDLKQLEQILQIPLPTSRQKKYNYQEQIPQQHIDLLREMLQDEYQLYEKAKQLKNQKTINQIKNILSAKMQRAKELS